MGIFNTFTQNPGDPCQDVSGDITQYQITFQTATENVNIARCTAGRCSYPFDPASSGLISRVPSSYDSVSVAAKNVVGVGAAKTCTAQIISKLVINQAIMVVGAIRYMNEVVFTI